MRIIFITWLFSITILTILCIRTIPVYSQCLEDQRSLLLQLKKTLDFNLTFSVKLVNWTQGNDCCGWKGVTCDQNGCVTGLDLNSESINGGVNKNSSLFSLKFLESLNLANNSFKFTQIPSSFGNLTNLTCLNLSNAEFSGQIPIEFSHLKRLVTLDLSTLYFPGIRSLQLQNPNLSTLLQNLTELTELRLDGVNISAPGIEWCQTISYSLPNLRVLSLSNCNLSGPIDSSLQKLRYLSEIHLGENNLSVSVPEFSANFTNLTVLSLSSSNLEGQFPPKIFQVPTLQTLDLSCNRKLQGSLPEFLPNGSLQSIVLSNTNFSGSLPDSIGKLRNLSRIDLSDCNFAGPIPNSMANLGHLVYLDLSSNNFTGPIPSFQMSKNLTHIDLSHNALIGSVPSSYFTGLSNLVNVDLAYNSFNGSIPLSLFSLRSLQKILLSDNQFGGEVIGFLNGSLSPLDTLDLSSNKLEGPIPSYFFDFGRLNILSLSFNKFSGTLQLERIRSLPNLTRLDLSYNNLSINASGSNSSMSSFPYLSILRLASCNLQNFPPPMNQSRMAYLDLSDNQISGEIPNWIWNIGNGNLLYLNLSRNLLVGMQRPHIIPNNLIVLDLHSNLLHGEIPVPPESVMYVDYSGNYFSSSIPAEIGKNLTLTTFFSLSNNNLTGPIPKSICNATDLLVLDLSNNRFNGTIPQCLIESCYATLGVLNLHNNSLTGNILGTFPESCALKTLDFNGNHLEGQVPKSLANCTNLEVLNLGNNSLYDNFPCFLKSFSSLRILNLRANKFQGVIRCEGEHNDTWPKLQIIDIALNNFSGVLPQKFFLYWNAMMIDGGNAKSELNHLRFEFLNPNHFYYQDTVTVTNKGQEWCQTISYSLPNLRVLSLSNCNLLRPIDSSLQKLQCLSEIHLGNNNLSVSVPEFFANFTNLTVLSLSSFNLEGQFPPKIFQVPTLQTLDLSHNIKLQGSLPKFLQNGSLQMIVLSDSNFLGGLPDSIGNLRNLSRIDLSCCNFSGPIPNSMANLSHLVYLDLSSNNFTGPIPSFQMSKNLTYIDLSHNALIGSVPSSYFTGLSNLVYVNLAYNSFSGRIPLSLFSLPSLQKILLSNNQFGGEVAEFLNGSLSPLDTLDLSSNKLEGPIRSHFFDFGRLNILLLSFNNFSGTTQLAWIQRLQNLTKLDLSYNNLSIIASESNSSLTSLPQLSTLRLASCKLQRFPSLMNQLRMVNLDLSDNQISGEIPNWIWNVGNGTLTYLNLSYNLLVGMQRHYTIPSLFVLDLHSNQLHGEIPIPPESAVYVDYSSNNFNSSIPLELGNNLTSSVFFSLSNNNLTGAISQSICNASNLQVLDLSNNRFSGTIPQCLIENCTTTLGVLNLRNNSLTGNISGTFPENCALKTLDFNGNHFVGHVPQSLGICTKLEVLNLGNNNVNDIFPYFLKNSSHLRVLNLRSNKFQGGIQCGGDHNNSWPKLQIIDLALNNFNGSLPKKCFLHWKAMMVDGGNGQSDMDYLRYEFLNGGHFYYQDTVTVTIKGLQLELVKILTVFISIDFSKNSFQGDIPDSVGNLKYLYVLNLSHNALTGHIPSSLGNLTQLESLDLSMNKLSGSIPEQLASLTFLSFLNLSFNRLVGRIPIGTQIQTFSETSFEGNIGLCGLPLNTNCSNVQMPVGVLPLTPDEDGDLDFEPGIYISFAIGFVVGFGSFIGVLALCKRWGQWYYKHVDQVLERTFHLEERRRRRNRRKRAYKDPIRRL